MTDFSKKSSYNLILLRHSWLNVVNDVTNSTGAMLIRGLNDLDAELERRFGKLTPAEWKEKEEEIKNTFFTKENLSPEELSDAADFFDRIMVERKDFYKGKRLMPGQDQG